MGLLGPEKLAAAALATTICNITGMSFSVGLSSALCTLTGQARGDLMLKGEQREKRELAIKAKKRTGRAIEEYSAMEKEHKSDDDHATTFGDRHDEELVAETSPLLEEHLSISYGGEQNNERHEHVLDNQTSETESSALPLLQPVVFLLRGMAIQFAIVIPIGLWWIKGLKPFLIALGQGEALSSLTETYLRILSLGLWGYSFNWTIISWLQSIAIADVQAFAAFVGFSTHIPFTLLFMDVLGCDYLGVAMATVTFQMIQPAIVCGYLFGTARGRERVLEGIGAKHVGRTYLTFWPEARAAVSSISGIKQYLSLALPGMVIISEWWASECITFLSGRLSPNPDISLGATSIYQSINTFFFMFPVGFSAASSARVGFFLGQNKPEGAKMATKIGVIFAGILSAVMGSILMFTPHEFFPSIFTDDKDVLHTTALTIPFLAVYVFADGIQVALNGVIKGCGRQAIVAPIVIFAYWVVGVPLAWYNSFERHGGTSICDDADLTCGVRGLVSAMTLGTWVHFVLCFCVVAFAIRWNEEAKRAHDRMSRAKL